VLVVRWLDCLWGAITAALAKRKAQGKPLGRSRIDPAIEEAIKAFLRPSRPAGKASMPIARKRGVGSGTVQRIRKEMIGTRGS
jgi:DNA invertase Pin-like site-specific DNA recombinase